MAKESLSNVQIDKSSCSSFDAVEVNGGKLTINNIDQQNIYVSTEQNIFSELLHRLK